MTRWFSVQLYKTHRYVFLLLLIALSFGVYIGSLSNNFVWDDKYEILQNDWIKDVNHIPDIFLSHSLGWLRPEQSSTKYGPLKLFVRLVQYHLSGTDPWAYQLTNVFVHVMATLMVYLISARLFSDIHGEKTIVFPFAASLLFGVHPIHTEPVNWVIGLSELSMTLFCLLSFYQFMKSTARNDRVHVLPGLFLFIALLFKVTAVFFVLVLAAYDYALSIKGAPAYPNAKSSRSILLRRYLPLVLAIIGYFALYFFVTAGESDPVKTNHIRLDHYDLIRNVPLLFYQYMEKLVLPLQLNALYVFHPVSSYSDVRFLLPVCFALIFFLFVAITWKKDVLLSLCLLWIVLPLIPCLYLPATGYSYYVFAERYLYLPSGGYVIGVVALSRIALKRSFFNKYAFHCLALLLIVTGMFFTVLTLQRNYVWKDDFSLWSDTVNKSPDSDVVHNNLGVAYEHKGLLDDALREYELAIALNPLYMDAFDNRFRVMKIKTFSGAGQPDN